MVHAIQVTERADGCVINVRAQPGARRNGIVGEHAGALKVAVTAPADKGRANDAILGVLATAFGLKHAQIELLSGHRSRQKDVLLLGLTLQQVRSKLRSLLTI
ncbi:MAG: YggU family protein [Gemmataceae bacterium]|nr:YggU family protein [Gemmataceae bacterium]